MITKTYNWLKNKDDDLTSGLVVGLTYGLASGLAVGLANLSTLIPITTLSIIMLIAGTIILMEFLIGFNKKEKKISWRRIIWLKFDALLTSLAIIINSLIIIYIIRNYRIDWEILTKWFGYIGIGLITLAIVGGLIYLLLLWNKNRLTK